MTEKTELQKLRIRYHDPDGNQTELLLSDKPITIGRSPEADIITLDERASRMHCGIRIWDGEYYVKDLKSKNGTYLNNQKVEMAKIKPGDKIRIGNNILTVDDKKSPGTETTMTSVQDEMDGGKGYKTILREIVQNTESSEPAKPKPAKVPESKTGSTEVAPVKEDEPRTKTAKLMSNSNTSKVPAQDESNPEPNTDSKPSGSGSKVIRLNKSKPSSIKIKRK